MDNMLIIPQMVLLGFVAAIGISFTFALPVPRHQLKARSVKYARWFLASAWMVFVCQAIAYSGFENYGLPGLYGFAITSAYMLLMSVLKRYGYRVTRARTVAATAHVAVIVIVTFVFQRLAFPDWLTYSLVLSSAALPIWQANKCVSLHLKTETNGGHLLRAVLISVLLMLLVGIPLYLHYTAPGSVYHLTATFALMLLIMLSFMLAYAVNILQSLLLKLRSQIHTDPLTGAKNRHYFYEVAPKLAAHAQRQREQLSVVACDIDHFKKINDIHGHVVGDVALRRFCQIILNELRMEDTLIRMGGEEFLIMSPRCDGEQARQLAERLRTIIADSEIEAKGVNLKLTASFGVIEMNAGGDLNATVKSADQALYDAKANGRNRVIMV